MNGSVLLCCMIIYYKLSEINNFFTYFKNEFDNILSIIYKKITKNTMTNYYGNTPGPNNNENFYANNNGGYYNNQNNFGYDQNSNPYQNNPNANYSPFSQTFSNYENGPAKVSDLYGAARTAFIKKVYLVLSCQLLFTVFLAGLSMMSQGFFRFQIEHVALFYLALIITVAIQIYMFCCGGGRTYPQNLICTSVFTLCQGYIVSFICSATGKTSGNSVVFMAAFMTLAIVVGCTLYAIFTEQDFTTCGALLVVVSVIMLVLFVILLFTDSPFLNTVYCALGVFLFSIYLIIDTQMIVGGRSVELAIDQYYFGALLLYIDIITIFLYLLELFRGSGQ